MVRFVDRPYVTKKVEPKISSIKWKLLCGIGMTRIFFITLADNRNDLFDIYPAAVFKQKRIRKSDRIIIGVADSAKGARELIEEMIGECMHKGSLSDIRGYFENYIRDHI